MASNKLLTDKQETFVDYIMQGYTQRQAYYKAYPTSTKWPPSQVDTSACILFANPKVKERLRELGYRDKSKLEWTRNKALETINLVMELNQQDLERIVQAYENEKAQLEGDLIKYANLMTVENIDKTKVAEEIRKTNAKLDKLNKQVRVNRTNIQGIYDGAKILNRLFGLDIAKVEISQTDTQKEVMKDLSLEELKSLAYSQIKEQ